MAHPFLPLVRWSAAPAGRRYLAGWPMATEVHVLGEAAMEKRAAGDASLEALKGTAERLYTEIVIAANNERIPPPWTPFRFTRYLRWAWLVEGAAQHFSRQVDLYRAAVIRRLREGSRPTFPPSRRDAILLGGTIFAAEAAPASCWWRDCGGTVPRPISKRPSTCRCETSKTSGANTCGTSHSPTRRVVTSRPASTLRSNAFGASSSPSAG